MTRALGCPLVALLAALASACASAPAREPVPARPGAAAMAAPAAAPAPLAPPEQRLAASPFGALVQQWTALPGSLFVKRPRPDFSAYHALRLEPPVIYYGEHSDPPLRRDHETLVASLRDLVAAQTPAAIGLPVGRARGAGVLRVRSEVSDLDFDRDRMVGSSRVTSIIQPGRKALFILELADDATGEPLLRVASVRILPGGIYTGPWSPEIDRARQLFGGFVDDARATLGTVFGETSAQ